MTSGNALGEKSDVTPGDDRPEVRHARDSKGDTAQASLAKQLSQMARELQAEPDMDALLNAVVATTVEEIDGARYGGISLLERGKVHAVAATDPVVERLDSTQNELGEGPCITSLREQVTVRANDFTSEQRWPKFCSAARNEGIQAMLSVQLFVEGDNLGALNLYAAEPNAFDIADESTAMALAAHAAVAMKSSRMESNLRTALLNRDVIGQAKGILMERFKISPDDAFGLLTMASQRTHRKLSVIADDLTRTGELGGS